LGRPEVEDGPDRWAPPVTWRKRKERGSGPVVADGLVKRSGPLRKKKGKRNGWAIGLERRERKVWGVVFFLLNPLLIKSFKVFFKKNF
jgi:hypothetical protein